MNPGTFYLYEYENFKRRRNVGFIKVTRHYQSCILQIHAGGIPVRAGSTLTLSAFFCEQNQMITAKIASLESCGRNISLRLSVSETHFPGRRPLQQIDGFLLEKPENKTPVLFWMASSFFFDIWPDMMRPYEPEVETMPELETIPEPEAVPEAEAAPEKETVPEPDSASEPETVPATDSIPESEPAPTPEPALQSAETKTLPQAKKIGRSDLSLLPRRFWTLANNSFLLHGYHNYKHLVLIEEDGRRWLGVPGIYDTREARAADLFGFPRFTRAYVSVLDLTDEERNDAADFGYWCRCVGTCSSGDTVHA